LILHSDIEIDKLRKACIDGRIKWTSHTLERMQERGIEPTDIIFCINEGTIIEQYPQAFPYPACLVLGRSIDNRHLHTVVGHGSDMIWIITAYMPDNNEWLDGFSMRKE
jgi:hypothetical protein